MCPIRGCHRSDPAPEPSCSPPFTTPHPSPPVPPLPGSSVVTDAHLSFVRFNCNGIQPCHPKLASFLHRHHIATDGFKESKLTDSYTLKDFPINSALRIDRPGEGGGGGFLILIRRNITYTTLKADAIFPSIMQWRKKQWRSHSTIATYESPISTCTFHSHLPFV